MSRKYVDCRDMPSESGCTLAIIGEADEVVAAAVQHVKSVHGHTEPDDQIAEMVRADLKDAPGVLA